WWGQRGGSSGNRNRGARSITIAMAGDEPGRDTTRRGPSLMQFVWFLGRFHVLILHLPLGILTLAVALEILVRFRPFRFLENAVAATWTAGAVSALATVALGFMHATEDSFEDMDAVEAHGWAGVTLAALSCLTAILRTRMHPVSAWPW